MKDLPPVLLCLPRPRMPDVEALAETVRENLLIIEEAFFDGSPMALSMCDDAIRALRPALDGLVEAAGKTEAGRASAAPTSPPGEAGAGAEDTAKALAWLSEFEREAMMLGQLDYRTPAYNRQLETVLALAKWDYAANATTAISGLVEAVRQRDAEAAEYARMAEGDLTDLRVALGDLLDVAERIRGGDPKLDPEEWYASRDYARIVLARALSHRGEPK